MKRRPGLPWALAPDTPKVCAGFGFDDCGCRVYDFAISRLQTLLSLAYSNTCARRHGTERTPQELRGL
eukprot:13572280-Alexandrium_andersonii.AAC.1